MWQVDWMHDRKFQHWVLLVWVHARDKRSHENTALYIFSWQFLSVHVWLEISYAFLLGMDCRLRKETNSGQMKFVSHIIYPHHLFQLVTDFNYARPPRRREFLPQPLTSFLNSNIFNLLQQSKQQSISKYILTNTHALSRERLSSTSDRHATRSCTWSIPRRTLDSADSTGTTTTEFSWTPVENPY